MWRRSSASTIRKPATRRDGAATGEAIRSRRGPVPGVTDGRGSAWTATASCSISRWRPDWNAALSKLVRELVDYRLAQYRARRRGDQATSQGFVCRVLSNQRDPILKLPARDGAGSVPEGETDVRLPDGAVWQFRFAKEYCNVARPAGTARNQLPDLLRGWFGPRAGRPGTRFEVRFVASPDGLWASRCRRRSSSWPRGGGSPCIPICELPPGTRSTRPGSRRRRRCRFRSTRRRPTSSRSGSPGRRWMVATSRCAMATGPSCGSRARCRQARWRGAWSWSRYWSMGWNRATR